MSPSEKSLVLAAADAQGLREAISHPVFSASLASVVLRGRRGILDYTLEELDSEIEDYAEDFMKLAGSCDSLVAWAQNLMRVQYVNVESKTWETF